jgi:hypothetical protein
MLFLTRLAYQHMQHMTCTPCDHVALVEAHDSDQLSSLNESRRWPQAYWGCNIDVTSQLEPAPVIRLPISRSHTPSHHDRLVFCPVKFRLRNVNMLLCARMPRNRRIPCSVSTCCTSVRSRLHSGPPGQQIAWSIHVLFMEPFQVLGFYSASMGPMK